jgi:hypothetical protein
MKLDEPEDSYLAFVAAVRRRDPGPVVERALVELTPTIDTKLKLVEYSSTGSGSGHGSDSIRIQLSRPLEAPPSPAASVATPAPDEPAAVDDAYPEIELGPPTPTPPPAASPIAAPASEARAVETAVPVPHSGGAARWVLIGIGVALGLLAALLWLSHS